MNFSRGNLALYRQYTAIKSDVEKAFLITWKVYLISINTYLLKLI